MWRVGRQERHPSLLLRLAFPTQNKAALVVLWCAYAVCAYLALAAAEDVGLMAFTRFRHPTHEKFADLRTYNDRRHHLFYDKERLPAPIGELERISHKAPEFVRRNLESVKRRQLLFEEGDFGRAKECSKLPQLDRLADPYCRAAWSHALQYSPVAEIKTLYTFTSDRLASFVVTLENGMRAMYKPCAGSHEYPECEVISYYLDVALGFNRVSPMVLRNFTVDAFRHVVRQQRGHLVPGTSWELETLDQVEATCAEGGVMHGVMTGWWDDVRPARSWPKKAKFGEAKVDGMSPVEMADVAQNHYFCYLLQLLREPGKNEFRQSGGELLMIDLDRAQFYFYTSTKAYRLNFCTVCRFSRRLWETATALADADQEALWAAIAYHLAEDVAHPIVLDNAKVDILRSRVASIADCMRRCYREEGEAVFVQEAPWLQ